MTTDHNDLTCFVSNVVHHTLARRLFVLWTSKGASEDQIDHFFSSARMELINSHSVETLDEEHEASLVAAILRKLDEFESAERTDRAVFGSLSGY
jgi:hypothetical protein